VKKSGSVTALGIRKDTAHLDEIDEEKVGEKNLAAGMRGPEIVSQWMDVL